MNKKTFENIKDFQEDDILSHIVATQMELDLDVVENAFTAKNFEEYVYLHGTEEEKKALDAERVSPAQSGYYKGLVAKKYEENSNLKEQRAWLLEQVYFLRKSITFLETRKRELEDGIVRLQKNIIVGIGAMEQLEENENFTKLSEKTKKINR